MPILFDARKSRSEGDAGYGLVEDPLLDARVSTHSRLTNAAARARRASGAALEAKALRPAAAPRAVR